MKFLEKMCVMIVSKVTKNQGFIISLGNTLLEKPMVERGAKLTSPNIKNCTYYYLNDIINIDKFNPKNIKVDTKFYKDILIFYIVYETLDGVTRRYIDFDR